MSVGLWSLVPASLCLLVSFYQILDSASLIFGVVIERIAGSSALYAHLVLYDLSTELLTRLLCNRMSYKRSSAPQAVEHSRTQATSNLHSYYSLTTLRSINGRS